MEQENREGRKNNIEKEKNKCHRKRRGEIEEEKANEGESRGRKEVKH